MRTKTLHDLEWPRIVAAVLQRSTLPALHDGTLPIADTERETRQWLGEVSELFSLLLANEQLPLHGLKDIRPHLARLEKHGMLDGPALLEMASTLKTARLLRVFLLRNRHQLPLLADVCAFDPTLDTLEQSIDELIDPSGIVRDDASPALHALRTETGNLKHRINARLEELMRKHESLLQDEYYTVRDGRYVLPVRANAHDRFPGIVHGTSASGATLFIEPRALVELGNRLRVGEAEMQREEARILSALSDQVSERVHEIAAALSGLSRVDLRQASARFGIDLGGSIPVLLDSAKVVLQSVRHPALVLDGNEVVAHDLELEAGKAVVISGPNAGGKTVAMKALAVHALMVRCGLPAIAGAGTQIGFFDPIMTDVGDEQSVSRNLSTFSAHIRNLSQVFEHAHRGALVILDELASGTDPEEGAALACAVVDKLCSQGAAVVVTTHYERLKAMAFEDSRVRNASVGFDYDKMEPNFRLRWDIPGASSALSVAARFGMPADVVAEAKGALSADTQNITSLLERLESQWTSLERESEQLRRESERADAARRSYEEKLMGLRERSRMRLSEEAEALLDSIRHARQAIAESAQRIASETVASKGSVAELARAVSNAAALVGIGGEVHRAIGQADEAETGLGGEVRPGDHVYVDRLRTDGFVLEVTARGKVQVRAGALKLWVDEGELSAPKRGNKGHRR